MLKRKIPTRGVQLETAGVRGKKAQAIEETICLEEIAGGGTIQEMTGGRKALDIMTLKEIVPEKIVLGGAIKGEIVLGDTAIVDTVQEDTTLEDTVLEGIALEEIVQEGIILEGIVLEGIVLEEIA